MRMSHVQLIGVAIVTFGVLVAGPARAQADEPPLNPVQQEELDGWPEERKAAYAAWPNETKAYYWTLSPERQELFWALADSDKIALTAMTGPEREAAWTRIEARVGSPPADV